MCGSPIPRQYTTLTGSGLRARDSLGILPGKEIFPRVGASFKLLLLFYYQFLFFSLWSYSYLSWVCTIYSCIVGLHLMLLPATLLTPGLHLLRYRFPGSLPGLPELQDLTPFLSCQHLLPPTYLRRRFWTPI